MNYTWNEDINRLFSYVQVVFVVTAGSNEHVEGQSKPHLFTSTSPNLLSQAECHSLE